MRMLVTRAEPDAEATAARLAALGIEALVLPLLERVTLDATLPAPEAIGALALTSTNALRALDERGALAAFTHFKLFAVGERTAEAARAAGCRDVVACGGTLAHLAAEIAASGIAGPIFYPTARHRSGDLAQHLTAAGIATIVTPVYEMRPRENLPAETLGEIAAGRIGAALLYSRRTAEIFVALARPLEAAARRRFGLLCLSAEVAASPRSAGFVEVAQAASPTEAAMMNLALAFAGGQNAA